MDHLPSVPYSTFTVSWPASLPTDTEWGQLTPAQDDFLMGQIITVAFCILECLVVYRPGIFLLSLGVLCRPRFALARYTLAKTWIDEVENYLLVVLAVGWGGLLPLRMAFRKTCVLCGHQGTSESGVEDRPSKTDNSTAGICGILCHSVPIIFESTCCIVYLVFALFLHTGYPGYTCNFGSMHHPGKLRSYTWLFKPTRRTNWMNVYEQQMDDFELAQARQIGMAWTVSSRFCREGCKSLKGASTGARSQIEELRPPRHRFYVYVGALSSGRATGYCN